MKQQKVWWQPFAVLTALAAFFVLIFYMDNKYQTPPPYGESGIICINERELDRDNPIFLIDGWLLTDGEVKDKPTYIGEFSNLQRGKPSASPHGRARYQLTLRYEGESQIVSVDFPQLSYWYSISLNGMELVSGAGNGTITFLLTSGDQVLVVETVSEIGYYSGIYFPPSLGTVQTVQQTRSIQNFAYTLAVLLPLALAVFTLFLWKTGGSLSRWFGLLCICYASYVFRYFVFLFSMPMAHYWFLIQNLALYGLCFCVMQIIVLAADAASGRAWMRTGAVLLMLPLVLQILCLLIPIVPWAVFVHGKLTDIYYIFTFCSAAFFAMRGMEVQNWKSRYTLACGFVFEAGLLVNLFFSNLFEPIRFFWQFEWCGLLLVLLFGAMMVSRSRRILRENDMLTNHLEEQVKKRTEEVTQLLAERKAFFSDMAHDLKAPVFAAQSYIKAIRSSGVGVDKELQNYLEQAEAKQWELARRLQGLSTINELDRIEEEWERVPLQEMLSEIYAIYHGEAEIQSVYLTLELPKEEAYLRAQPEKLHILFENLIYNALRATPSEGIIRISAIVGENKIWISLEDTGCGIPEEELPFIFQRFYVGENNRENGTGLGLYIVQSIVAELGGDINVQSVVGRGTTFRMEFPQEL